MRPHRLTARTPGFHPGNRSSILRGVTDLERSEKAVTLSKQLELFTSENRRPRVNRSEPTMAKRDTRGVQNL